MSVEPLTNLFVSELLNALDDIQQDIPIILDAYLEGTLPTELEIDIDLLAANLTGLRDSAKLSRSILDLNDTVDTGVPLNYRPPNPFCNRDVFNTSLKGGLEFSANGTEPCTPVENNCLEALNLNKYKSIGLAMFLHIHMLTDETSIYYTESFNNPFYSAARE